MLAWLVWGTPFVGILFSAVGWFGPKLWLGRRQSARLKAFNDQLADTIALMSNSLRSGLSLVREIGLGVGPREALLHLGRSRRDALKDMALRTQVPDLNNFVGAILRAEQLGVSATKVLTVQAEQMRVVRHQRAEEKAA